MTNVFIRYNPQNDLRYHLAMACLERWKLEPYIDITLCIPRDCKYSHPEWLQYKVWLDPDYFWIEAKKYAEEHSQSDIYCVADDDQLLLGREWIRYGVECLKINPHYGMISAWAKNEEHYLNINPFNDVIDLTNFSIGCPYFVKKGTIKKFDKAPIMKQDSVLSQHIKEQGLRLGFIKHLRYNHLGCGFSTADEKHWICK